MQNEIKIVHEVRTSRSVKIEHNLSPVVIVTIFVTALLIGDAIIKLGKSIERCGAKTVEVSK